LFYNPMKLIRKFHKAFSIRPDREPRTLKLRADLISEETQELLDELAALARIQNNWLSYGDYETYAAEVRTVLTRIAKEGADLLVVVYGMFDTLGIPAESAFKEVMKANMSKLGPDGKPLYREDGKVLKGPNYQEADMRGAVFGEWL
jgi:predicted HAD superfamily Cof-like phosphohydrolase